MGRKDVSSARPNDLEDFASASRGLDGDLKDARSSLMAAYRAFKGANQWGVFEADSLLSAFGRYIDGNGFTAKWVAHVAALFRAAGGGKFVKIPDLVIQKSLGKARLTQVRGNVTFDSPVAWGAPPTTGYANDPINTATGNFVEIEGDLVAAGLIDGLTFSRTYNSRSDRIGPFGRGWASWATARLGVGVGVGGAEYVGPDGQEVRFARLADGYDRAEGIDARVEPLADGLALRWPGGARWIFDEAGRPISIGRGPGTEVRFRHDADGRLVEMAHTGGKHVRVDWDTERERIDMVECSDGRRVSYTYDVDANLVAVEGEAGPRRYELDERGRVVSVMDGDGVVELFNTYDEDGRVLEQLSPFGRRTSLMYLPGLICVTMDDDDDGPVNTYIHDAAGRLTAVIDGDQQQLSMAYDERGNLVAVTERNGAVTIQDYDDRDRATRRVLPTGATFAFVYDDADRVVEVALDGAVTRYRHSGDERIASEIVDPEGGITRQTVEGGRVHRAVDPDGVAVEFEFDADGNVVASTDGDGHTARLDRDAAGRVVAGVSPLGRRTEFVHDAVGRLVERHDPVGGVWRYEYSAAGRLGRVTDPTGATEEITYGPHGSPSATVDALGRVTTNEYDAFGNVVGVVEPGGAAWQHSYDALMQLTATVDPSGARWGREYDVNGELVATIDPSGVSQRTSLDGFGRVVEVSDGLTTEGFEFDELGRVVARVSADGSRMRIAYDRCGRRTSVEGETGAVTRFEYTPAGRVARCVYPSGRTDTYDYDACGRMAARVDGAGRRWEFRYEADANLTQITLPTGEIERLEYDEDGRLRSSSAPGSGTTTREYDPAGRLVGMTDREAGERRFVYDAAGRMIEAIDANGSRTTYDYDERDRMTKVVDPLGGVVSGHYDAVGRMVSLVDALGRTTTRSYDPAGRIVEQVDGSGRTVRQTYDAAGRLSAVGPAGASPASIEYDERGRVVAVVEPGAPPNRLAWDAAGRLVERRRGELAMRWAYGADGERTAIGYPDGTQTTYTHDDGGYVVAASHPTLGAIELQRDAAGRLVGATGDGMQALWRYDDGDLVEYEMHAGETLRTAQLIRDPIGRVVQATIDGAAHEFAYDAGGQLVTAANPGGNYAFEYDSGGRLTRESSPAGDARYDYDAAGQLSARRNGGESATSYEYDGAGRRVRESGAGLDRTYRWDEIGRLAEVTVGGNGGQPRSIGVVVDALGELASLDGSPMLWDTAHPLAPLTWTGEDAVVGEGTPWALAGNGATRWLAPDWQGTIGDALRDPWGALVGGADAAALGLGYRGEVELGAATWLRNRVYEPGTRSFLQRDPLPPAAGTAVASNPYHYAANNAIGLSDPLGLCPISPGELQAIRNRMDRGFVDEVVDHSGEISLVLSIAAVAFPPAGLVLGGAALAFGVISAGKSLSEGDYGGAVLDMAGTVPGVRGLRAGMQARAASRAAARHGGRAATQTAAAAGNFGNPAFAGIAQAQRHAAGVLTRRKLAELGREADLKVIVGKADSAGMNLGAYGVLRNWDRDNSENGGINVPLRPDPLRVPVPSLGLRP